MRRTFFSLFAALGALLAPALSAQTVFTWSGAGSDTNITTGANWVGGTAPTNTGNGSLVFNGTSNLTVTNSFSGNFLVSNITFGSAASSYTIAPLTSQAANILSFNENTTSSLIEDDATAVETIGAGVNIGTNGTSLSLHVSNSTGVLVLTGNISGSHSVSINGNGTVYYNGGNNSYSSTGGTNINSGTLEIGITTLTTTQPLGATSRPVNLNGGTLSLDGGSGTPSITNTVNVLSNSTINVGNSTTALNETFGNTSVGFAVGNATTSVALSINLPNSASVLSFNGPFGVNAGGNGSVSFGASNGTLRWNGSGTTNKGGANISFDMGSGSLKMNSGASTGTILLGALSGGPGTVISGDSKTATATPIIYSIGNTSLSADTTFSGTINDGANGNTTAITKVGPATLTFNGSGNYSGATTISSGTLAVSVLSAGGSNSSIGAATNVATNLVINGGSLKYIGSGSTTDRLFTVGTGGATLDASGSGAVSFTNAGSIAYATPGSTQSFSLTFSGTGSGAFAPVIADQSVSNITNVVKNGSGSWTLSGLNTYTGSTNINNGTLVLTGNLGSGALNINNTGTLGGNGYVQTGTVTLETGGDLAPGFGLGNSTLSLPNLTWNAGSNLTIGVINGVGSDNLTLAGILTKSGVGTFIIDFDGASFTSAANYTIISYASESGFSPNDFTAANLTIGGGLSGNFFVGPGSLSFDITAVPEPAVYGLGAGLAAFVVAGLRRRRA